MASGISTVVITDKSKIQDTNGKKKNTEPEKINNSFNVENVGKYKLIRTIGRGNFAKVKLAKHIPTGQEVAIKIIDRQQLNKSSISKLQREVKILKFLSHPNIVKLYEVIEMDNKVYLVMEYASGGEVFDYIVAHGRLNEKEARSKFRQIVSAIQYCHQNHVVHRDLKAENMLMDAEFNIKIADFGFSNEFVPGTRLDTFCGSPPYAAPELFQGKQYEGPSVDIWSLGVVLYTLVSGALPFDGANLKELREKVLKGKYRIPFFMSTECESLLRKLLIINPSKRLTLENIMNDPWINIGYEDNKLEPFISTPFSINENILESMVLMGFNKMDVKKSLNSKNYDHLSATYYLLEKQHMREPVQPTIEESVIRSASAITLVQRNLEISPNTDTASLSLPIEASVPRSTSTLPYTPPNSNDASPNLSETESPKIYDPPKIIIEIADQDVSFEKKKESLMRRLTFNVGGKKQENNDDMSINRNKSITAKTNFSRSNKVRNTMHGGGVEDYRQKEAKGFDAATLTRTGHISFFNKVASKFTRNTSIFRNGETKADTIITSNSKKKKVPTATLR